MGNRFFVAVALLVLGFFLFAFSTIQNSNNAILNIVAEQQGKMIQLLQQKGDHKRSCAIPTSAQNAATPPVVPSVDNDAQVQALQNRIQTLESRLAQLETDTKPVVTQIKAMEEQRKAMEEAMKKVYDLEIGNSPIRGNKNAPVTLVEFTDFQCPYCSRFHSVQADLLKAYPDKVRFVIKNYPLPFHPLAKPAAKAVLAAGLQGKYWEMVDAILKDNSNLSEAKFEELAKALGLNMDKFRKDLKDKDAEFEKTIQADMELAQKVFVRGTPSFYINGKMAMPDPQSMKARIDEVLSGK